MRDRKCVCVCVQVLIDAIVWAIKHRERNIADAGLTILLEMLRNLDGAGEVRAQPPPTHTQARSLPPAAAEMGVGAGLTMLREIAVDLSECVRPLGRARRMPPAKGGSLFPLD